MSGKLPKGWEWMTVGELCKVEYGKGLPRKRRVESGPVQVYGSAGLAGHHNRALVQEPAIVVGRKGNAGSVSLTKGPSWPIDTTYFLQPPPDVSIEFLASQLRNLDLARKDSSTTIPSLRRPDLEATTIAIAPFSEQRRIVECIDEIFCRLDEIDATLTSLLGKVELLRSAILADAFHFNRDLPLGWSSAPLEDLLVHSIGGAWGDPPGENERDVDVVRVTEFRDHGSLALHTAARRSVTEKQFLTRRLQPGDLILEKSGGGPKQPVGRVARFDTHRHQTICTNFTQLMRPDKSRVHNRFLHWQLHHRYMSGATAALNKGSGNIRNLQTKVYLEQLVVVAPINQQIAISQRIEDAFDHLSLIEGEARSSLEKLVGVRRLVLAEAFAGRLVPQDPTDEPASALLERIAESRPAKTTRREARV